MSTIRNIISIDIDSTPTEAEIRAAEISMHGLYNLVRTHSNQGAIVVPGVAAGSRIRLTLAQYTVLSQFEFVTSGRTSDVSLAGLTYEQQLKIIADALRLVKSCRVCNYIMPKTTGFIPPLMDQDENTKSACDALGFQANAGYISEIISEPGHENDTAPYHVDGHSFRAVPISVLDLGGSCIPAIDHIAMDAGLTAAEWGAALNAVIDAEKDLVVMVSTSTSIPGSAWAIAYKDVLAYAKSKGMTFAGIS